MGSLPERTSWLAITSIVNFPGPPVGSKSREVARPCSSAFFWNGSPGSLKMTTALSAARSLRPSGSKTRTITLLGSGWRRLCLTPCPFTISILRDGACAASAGIVSGKAIRQISEADTQRLPRCNAPFKNRRCGLLMAVEIHLLRRLPITTGPQPFQETRGSSVGGPSNSYRRYRAVRLQLPPQRRQTIRPQGRNVNSYSDNYPYRKSRQRPHEAPRQTHSQSRSHS